MHLRKLAPVEEEALHDYFIQLGKISIPARPLLQISTDPTKPSPQIDEQWAKWWLNWQKNRFKIKWKPIFTDRTNANDEKLIIRYFESYKVVVDEYCTQTLDQWTFDKTEFWMRMSRKDWVISADKLQRIYLQCPDNRESLTSIECIRSIEGDCLLIFILTSIQVLAPWFNNNLNYNISVTETEPRNTNDKISLQFLKYFEKFSDWKQKDTYRLLLMDNHWSYYTKNFFLTSRKTRLSQ